MDRPLDITIIGAGVIGCAVARELSRYHLRVAVAEAHPDLFGGTSARNSGVIHAGFHNAPGSLMARLCVEGNRLFSDLTAHLDVPMRRTGKLVVGFDEEDRAHLLSMLERGRRNGVPGLKLMGRDELRKLAPAVAGEFALYSASTGIVDPFQWTWALAENAAQNGVRFLFSSPLTAAVRQDGLWALTVGNRTLYSRWVINCAGLFSDKVAALLGLTGYEIYPCRGEYFLLDERLSSLLPLPAYPVPNYRTGGLGIHLTPTLEGNILIGPSTEYIDGPTDWRTTAPTQDMLLREGRRIFPSLSRSDCIRAFAGVRPKLTGPDRGGYDDFVICRREDVSPRVIHLIGMESPGLTASVPIAREVIRLLGLTESLVERADFDPIRQRPMSLRHLGPAAQARLIADNPDHGEIVCRCRTITRADVAAALSGPLPARTLTGLKYRCGAMMGRCQGGYCQTRLVALMEELAGIPREQLLYGPAGSRLFAGKVRDV